MSRDIYIHQSDTVQPLHVPRRLTRFFVPCSIVPELRQQRLVPQQNFFLVTGVTSEGVEFSQVPIGSTVYLNNAWGELWQKDSPCSVTNGRRSIFLYEGKVILEKLSKLWRESQEGKGGASGAGSGQGGMRPGTVPPVSARSHKDGFRYCPECDGLVSGEFVEGQGGSADVWCYCTVCAWEGAKEEAIS